MHRILTTNILMLAFLFGFSIPSHADVNICFDTAEESAMGSWMQGPGPCLFFVPLTMSNHYSTITKTNSFRDIQGVLPSEGQILLYSQFIDPSDFQSSNEFYRMIESQMNNVAFERAFVGRGAYKTPVTIDQMTASFFQNIDNIRYLLGSDYKIQSIDESAQNFTFQSARDLPLVSDLVGTVRMQVLEGNAIDTNMASNIQNLTGRSEQPQRVIIQDMNNFNKNVLFARMMTALYPNASHGTDVEVLSVSIFYDFPSFGSSFKIGRAHV